MGEHTCGCNVNSCRYYFSSTVHRSLGHVGCHVVVALTLPYLRFRVGFMKLTVRSLHSEYFSSGSSKQSSLGGTATVRVLFLFSHFHPLQSPSSLPVGAWSRPTLAPLRDGDFDEKETGQLEDPSHVRLSATNDPTFSLTVANDAPALSRPNAH